MSHTLLLVQPNRKLESRTYGDFESLDEALEGVCKIYEEHLKRENPHHASITYDISQVNWRLIILTPSLRPEVEAGVIF